jgi:hypothetical protein
LCLFQVAWEDLLKASDAAEKETSLIETLYLDAQGIEDKGIVNDLQTKLRHYVKIVRDREWPTQRAGHVPDLAEPDLHLIRASPIAGVMPCRSMSDRNYALTRAKTMHTRLRAKLWSRSRRDCAAE